MSSYSLMLRNELQGCNSNWYHASKVYPYTLASLSSDNNPTNFIFMHVCEFKTKSLEHTCRGSYHYQVRFLWCLSNLLQVVLMVDKKHKIQTKLAIYTCVKS